MIVIYNKITEEVSNIFPSDKKFKEGYPKVAVGFEKVDIEDDMNIIENPRNYTFNGSDFIEKQIEEKPENNFPTLEDRVVALEGKVTALELIIEQLISS